MINLIAGVKGTGKTKILMDKVNEASQITRGNVVCLEYGKKLKFNVFSQVRLIDTVEYDIKDGKSLYGFVCGLLAVNYDITELFIDSALKMCGNDMADFEEFFLEVNKIIESRNIHCLITASVDEALLPGSLKGFLHNAE